MTTIAYDKPVKDYIDELNATGHVTHRSYTKKSVTIHHNAGRLSHEGVLRVWQTRPASAHFDVDAAGAVCQYVKVNEYAWHAGNTQGNIESIGIEMANAKLAPNWEVSETTWKSAARLAAWLFAKVIKARPSASNLHYHHYWRSTLCAGPYMDSVYSQLLAETQRWYNIFTAPPPPPPKPIQGATYTGPRNVYVRLVRPGYRNESVRNFNGLVWAWLCKNSTPYARAHEAAWMREDANYFGQQAQLATQEMYRVLHARNPRDFDTVTMPAWPGKDGVKAIGGTPL